MAAMRGASIALAVIAVAAAPAAAAVTTSTAARAGLRLAGTFALAGRVTAAVGVPGERRGMTVLRQWTFQPTCPAGSCRQLILTRPRAGGVDRVLLRRVSSTLYTGRGRFTAPVSCAGATAPAGERVEFVVTVRIAAAVPTPAGPLASRVRATYESTARRNLTRCVAAFGRDAARYHGHLLPT
jgi:hypothetical protein